MVLSVTYERLPPDHRQDLFVICDIIVISPQPKKGWWPWRLRPLPRQIKLVGVCTHGWKVGLNSAAANDVELVGKLLLQL